MRSVPLFLTLLSSLPFLLSPSLPSIALSFLPLPFAITKRFPLMGSGNTISSTSGIRGGGQQPWKLWKSGTVTVNACRRGGSREGHPRTVFENIWQIYTIWYIFGQKTHFKQTYPNLCFSMPPNLPSLPYTLHGPWRSTATNGFFCVILSPENKLVIASLGYFCP